MNSKESSFEQCQKFLGLLQENIFFQQDVSVLMQLKKALKEVDSKVIGSSAVLKYLVLIILGAGIFESKLPFNVSYFNDSGYFPSLFCTNICLNTYIISMMIKF